MGQEAVIAVFKECHVIFADRDIVGAEIDADDVGGEFREIPFVVVVIEHRVVIFERHCHVGAFFRTGIVAVDAYARSCHDVVVGVQGPCRKMGVCEGVVLGVVCERFQRVVVLDAVAAGNGVADKFDFEFGLFVGRHELSVGSE